MESLINPLSCHKEIAIVERFVTLEKNDILTVGLWNINLPRLQVSP